MVEKSKENFIILVGFFYPVICAFLSGAVACLTIIRNQVILI